MAPRVLLASSNPSLIEGIKTALLSELPDAHVGVIGEELSFTSLTAISRKEPRPSLAIVDCGGDPEIAAQTISKIRVALPRTLLAAAAIRVTPEARKRATAAGAAAILEPPFRLEDLAIRAGQASRPGQVIAFIPGQGGTGASTIALHTAVSLARGLPPDGRGAMLADFDFQSGTLAFRLRLKPALTFAELLEAEEGVERLFPQAVAIWNGLDVLAAPALGRELAPDAVDRTAEVLEVARQRYDYCLIDFPGALYSSCRDVLRSGVEVVLVSTDQPVALHLADRRAGNLFEIGVPAEHVHLVLNRVDHNTPIAEEHAHLRRLKIAARLPNDYRAVSDAVLRGGLAAPDSELGKRFEELASYLLSHS